MTPLPGHHDPLLVALSIATAMFAAYAALVFAAEVAHRQDATRRGWLLGGALVMGMGIWSMHFIAMLAFRLPIPVAYDFWITSASLLIAILASGLALSLAARKTLGRLALVAGGSVMGLGIAAMHYTGMAAMHLPATLHHDHLFFIVSVLIAIAASMAALWMAFRLRTAAGTRGLLQRLGAAAIMGMAIAGMHYTAMAGAIFVPDASLAALPVTALRQEGLAITVTLSSFFILLVALVAVQVNRHTGAWLRSQHFLARNWLVLIAAIYGVSFWLFELFMGSRALQGGSGLEQLWGGDPAALWTRSVTVVTALGFGLIAQLAFNRASRLHRELEQRVQERTAELLQANESMRHALASLEQSETRQRAVLETVVDGIITIDDQGIVQSFNRAAERIFQYRADEVVGHNIAMLMPQPYATEHDGYLANYRNTGMARVIGIGREVTGRRKDGATFSLELAVSEMQLNGQRQFTGIVRDISRRKAIEAKLEHSEQLANTIIDTAPEAIAVVDTEGRMTRVNTRMEQIFGYRKDELIGQPVEMLLPEGARQAHTGMRQGYAANATLRMMGAGRDLYGRRKDGSVFHVEVGLGPMQVGAQHFVIAALTDISQRKAAEAALRETSAKLARSNAELEQFAYVASHDLQEPLRMVASYVQLLERRYKSKLDDEAHEFIGYAADGAKRMQALITDLLGYSRVQTRGSSFAPTDLNRVLNDVQTDLEMAIRESRAELVCDPLPSVIADTTQMRQLLQNLVGNALKYRGDKVPHIHVMAKRIEQTDIELPATAPARGWLLGVSDNGIGIESQYHERIFQLFQRLHTRKEYEGTGLGLALCRRIAERHGGAIWVQSKFGEGSTFYVALPDIQQDSNSTTARAARTA